MLRVLVVEDNPTNMILTVFMLESAGHQVVQAENATLGIQLANEEQPELIFMDIQLPDMDGLEATKQLKADLNTQNIPVYALTAFAMKGDKERISAAGCDGYLSKPISRTDLLEVVETVALSIQGR
jgi:two-component system, cell cycle response regulator DivK